MEKRVRIVNTKAMFVSLLAFAILLGVVLTACSDNSSQKSEEADFTGVKAVCELATLKAYYHNVAEGDIPASGPLADLLKTGYKRMWVEYSGTVDFGIDASKVTISQPDENGKVEVHLPEIKVVSTNIDKESVMPPVLETGFLTSVSAEEKMAAVAAAQDKMKEQATGDTVLLAQAESRAKQIFENYVKNVGLTTGKSFTVTFV